MTEDAKIIMIQGSLDDAFTFNHDSLNRGKVKPQECLEVLADPFKTYCDELPSKRGNARRFWVGYTLLDRRLELGIEYRKNGIEHIYHARKAKKKLSRGQSIVNKLEMKRRNQRMTKIAQVKVAKRGIMQFRTAPEDILALFDLSVKRGRRVSTMVREWVLERLAQERGNAPVKLDITVNKEKVGSVSLASTVLNVINESVKPQKVKTKISKVG